MIYVKPITCTVCGFVEHIRMQVYGDFDGWDEKDLKHGPSACPFCKHAKKLDIKVPKHDGK